MEVNDIDKIHGKRGLDREEGDLTSKEPNDDVIDDTCESLSSSLCCVLRINDVAFSPNWLLSTPCPAPQLKPAVLAASSNNHVVELRSIFWIISISQEWQRWQWNISGDSWSDSFEWGESPPRKLRQLGGRLEAKGEDGWGDLGGRLWEPGGSEQPPRSGSTLVRAPNSWVTLIAHCSLSQYTQLLEVLTRLKLVLCTLVLFNGIHHCTYKEHQIYLSRCICELLSLCN